MPPAMLKSLAKRAGVSLRRAERYWKEAKKQAEETKKNVRDIWPYVVGIVKRRLGLANEDLALCGWPISLIMESHVEDCSGEGGCYITFEEETDDSKAVLEALESAGATLKAQLPTDISVPNVYSIMVSEEKLDAVKAVLDEHSISALAEKDVVDPQLTAAFLYDMCSGSFGGKSVLLNEKGEVKFGQAFKEMLLLEGVDNWKEWLSRLFPHVDLSLVMFMADQGGKR